MSWIKKHFNMSWLTIKQFIILFIVAVFFMVYIQFNNYNNTVKIETKRDYDNATIAMSSANDFINNCFNNTLYLMRNIASKSDIFTSSNDMEIQDYLYQINQNGNNISKTIYIQKSDGTIICSKQSLYDILGNDKIKECFQVNVDLINSIWCSKIYKSPISGNTMALVLPIKNRINEHMGTIIIEINLDYIYNGVASAFQSSGYFFNVMSYDKKNVLFQKDSSIFPSVKGVYPFEIPQSLTDKINSITGLDSEFTWEEHIHIIKSSINLMGWEVSALKEQSIISEQQKKSLETYILNTMIWMMILLVLTLTISNIFTVPIIKFANEIDKVVDFDNLKPIKIKSNDEIGKLSSSYNRMIVRINSLLVQIKYTEKKKNEYELKMLQSQIGPHFLYNTLACIGSLARQKRTDEVSEAIKALVSLLSFSFDKNSALVSIEDEIVGVEDYIKIQHMRYGNIFDLKLCISPETRKILIPKLSLQPLVENSIFHGIVPKNSNGYIKIKTYIINNNLYIDVIDNGIGMEENIKNKILTNKHDNEEIHDRYTSIGVINVYERLKLQFGDNVHFKLYSCQGKGTIIMIIIPLDNK